MGYEGNPFASATDGQLGQVMGLGSIPDRQQLLVKQLMQAQALRGQPVQNYGSAGANVIGGLGNLIGTIGGGIKARNLTGQLQSSFGQQDQGRLALAQMERARQQQAQGQAMAQPAGPPPGAMPPPPVQPPIGQIPGGGIGPMPQRPPDMGPPTALGSEMGQGMGQAMGKSPFGLQGLKMDPSMFSMMFGGGGY